jgi:hypothetical protein
MFQVRLRRSPDGSRLAATRTALVLPAQRSMAGAHGPLLLCPHADGVRLVRARIHAGTEIAKGRRQNHRRQSSKSWAHELQRAWQMRIGAGQYGSRVHHPRQRQPRTAQISPVWRHPQPGDSINGLGGGNGGLFRDAGCLAVPRANSFGTGDIFGDRLTQPIHILRHGVCRSKRHCDAGFVEGIEDGDP